MNTNKPFVLEYTFKHGCCECAVCNKTIKLFDWLYRYTEFDEAVYATGYFFLCPDCFAGFDWNKTQDFIKKYYQYISDAE